MTTCSFPESPAAGASFGPAASSERYRAQEHSWAWSDGGTATPCPGALNSSDGPTSPTCVDNTARSRAPSRRAAARRRPGRRSARRNGPGSRSGAAPNGDHQGSADRQRRGSQGERGSSPRRRSRATWAVCSRRAEPWSGAGSSRAGSWSSWAGPSWAGSWSSWAGSWSSWEAEGSQRSSWPRPRRTLINGGAGRAAGRTR